MVGGQQDTFDRALPMLEHLGKVVTYQGGPGAGQHAKMVNQIAIASGMVGVCEALLYALRAGLDVAKVIETIGTGAAASWSLVNYSPRALRGDFEPGFKIDHFIKDLGIALEEARRMGLALPGLALAEQLYSPPAPRAGARKARTRWCWRWPSCQASIGGRALPEVRAGITGSPSYPRWCPLPSALTSAKSSSVSSAAAGFAGSW